MQVWNISQYRYKRYVYIKKNFWNIVIYEILCIYTLTRVKQGILENNSLAESFVFELRERTRQHQKFTPFHTLSRPYSIFIRWPIYLSTWRIISQTFHDKSGVLSIDHCRQCRLNIRPLLALRIKTYSGDISLSIIRICCIIIIEHFYVTFQKYNLQLHTSVQLHIFLNNIHLSF